MMNSHQNNRRKGRNSPGSPMKVKHHGHGMHVGSPPRGFYSPPVTPLKELMSRSLPLNHEEPLKVRHLSSPHRELTFGGSRGPSPVAAQHYAGPKFNEAPPPQALPMPPVAWLNGSSGSPSPSPTNENRNPQKMSGFPSMCPEEGARVPATWVRYGMHCQVGPDATSCSPSVRNVLQDLGIKVRV